jgi:hypothetical protein
LNRRIRPMVHLATNALCSRSILTAREFAHWYAPFEAYIPVTSLHGSTAPPPVLGED